MPPKRSPRPTRPPARTPPPAGASTGYHRVRSLEVTGGFLSDLAVHFSDHLNCVIGGRGSGKTTLMQFLRFALYGRPDTGSLFDRLVEANLQTGQVRVVVETKDGVTYVIERTVTGEPSITDAQGKPTAFDLAAANVFAVDVYGQAEIEHLATVPREQMRLLDRFAADEVREVEGQIEGVLRALRANARELADLERQDSEREAIGTARLATEERLRAFPDVSGDEVEAVQREARLRAEREQVARTLQRLEPRIEHQRAMLAKAAEPLVDLTAEFPAAALTGPQGELLQLFGQMLAGCREQVRRAMDEASTAVERLRDVRAKTWQALGPRFDALDQEFRLVMARQALNRARVEERLALQRQLDDQTERLRQLASRDATLARLREARSGLRRELSELRDRRSAARHRVAAELTQTLRPEIQVTVRRGQDSSAYQALLNQALKGSGRPYQDMTRTAGERIAPVDLARMVRAGQVLDLATHLDVKPARAELLVQTLRDAEALYEVEVAEIEDVPSIALRVGGRYKTSEQLSTGQRCTTILPILLLDSGRPLLIDQPEDNLDNEYIFTHVVPQIERVRGRRQLIFATHNPNIPVLGDAGVVVVLKSTGERSQVAGQGTVDEVRGDVETILEGGKEAFQARLAKYGR